MKRLAIVIGVDRYEDETVAGLKVAVADASAFGQWLKELTAPKPFQVISLFGGGSDATKSAIIIRIRTECRRLREGDELVVFFAGHGCLLESGESREHLLLLSESRAAELVYLDEALSVAQLLRITAVHGVRRLFVLDACRDQLRSARSSQPPEFRGVRHLRDLVAQRAVVVDSPVTLLCSCDEGRCAQESVDLGGGLFTLSFLAEARATVLSGAPLIVDAALIDRVGRRMHAGAEAAGLLSCQRPWIEVGGSPWLMQEGSGPVADSRARFEGPSAELTRFAETSRRAWNGEARAQAELAELYAKGEGCAPSPEEALRWYLRAAEQGHSAAMYQVGYCLEIGEGCSVDPHQAVAWYRRAAERGQAYAMMRLSEMHARGYTPLARDPVEAFRLMQCAAARGPARAQYQLSVFYETGQGTRADLTQAALWAERAAAQGLAKAAHRAGFLAEARGRAGEAGSWARALDFYRKAAEGGLPEGRANFERLQRQLEPGG